MTKDLRHLKTWLPLVSAVPVLFTLAGIVYADGTTQPTFSQKILPLNCVFTVINAGTGELQYLTPAECGVVIPPPPNNPPVSSPAGTTQPVTPGAKRQVFFVPSTSGNLSSSNAGGIVSPPWQPIATNTASATQQKPQTETSPATAQTIAIIGVSLLVVVGLIILL